MNSWNSGGVTVLWPTNGLLLGVLLCSPKRRWPAYVAVGYAIDFSFNLSMNDPYDVGLYQSFCNIVEVLLAAFPLYPIIGPKPDLTQRRQFLAFLGYGVVLASAVASLMASITGLGRWAHPTWHMFHYWFLADALGMATVTPLYLAYHARQSFGGKSWREVIACLLLLSSATVLVFWQINYPLLFLLMPFLLLLALRLGLAGSALGLLLVSLIGGFLTTEGRGPMALVRSASITERELVLQGFLATSMAMFYVIEMLIAESRRLETDLRGSERRFRTLAEASSDIIVLTDLRGKRSYVSPASIEVLGWKSEDVLGGNFRDLVHPEDIAALEHLFDGCLAGEPPRSLAYRCRKEDGSYVWLEINPRVHRDPESGSPAGFVNVIRGISRRKLEEQEQQRAFETVEHLAWSDGLTGIANRRQFDVMLEREWLRALRERTNLSVILFDVDHFKAYNDIYGHLRGDDCLRQIVAAVKPLINRPADLLARYGGEEFVVILPNTEVVGACQIAEWIRRSVEECRLPHSGNPPHAVITLSIGCASAVPRRGESPLELLRAADQALYQAKASGRNKIQLANELLDYGTAFVRV